MKIVIVFPFFCIDFNKYKEGSPIRNFVYDAVHKRPHQMKMHWPVQQYFLIQEIFPIIVGNVGSNGQGYKHTKDQSTGTEGYLEYTKENEKVRVNQLHVAVGSKKETQLQNQDVRIIQSQKTTE